MLCLSGRIGEKFIVGGAERSLTVVVLERRGNHVRLGFGGEGDVDREAVWMKKYGESQKGGCRYGDEDD
jgi:sRNA-binding carbon storage regulator CsrA